MNPKTIICYGDSNTYGYDPRSFIGGRYDEENRWCDLTAERLGCQVVNCGENGRTIPNESWEIRLLDKALDAHQSTDLLVIMLGSNDVLMGLSIPVKVITERMEHLVEHIQKNHPKVKILLISPPHLMLPEENLCRKVREVGVAYQTLAQRREIYFCDGGAWNVPMAYDGVHFSKEGHRVFADKLTAFLKQL